VKLLFLIIALFFISLPFTFADNVAEVSIPQGTSVPGCEKTNSCYVSYEVTIDVGGEVTWSNDDTAAHTVTSGTPEDGPDGTFDSSLFMAGDTFSHKFEKSGTYNYFCMVHPWMEGIVIVETGVQGLKRGEGPMTSWDTDGDGIVDVLDLCPTQAETFNGYQDDDGCPDTVPVADSDGDGIPDRVDSCPTQSETFNGYQDDDGCPDTITIKSATATGMLSDGTIVSIWTSTPRTGEMMKINVEFKDAEHVNHDIKVTQNGNIVLDDKGAHHHDGKGAHRTKALNSSDPVDIVITFQGYGVSYPKTGPIGEQVVFSNIVPEFGTIVMMILVVTIMSTIAITVKSKMAIRT